MMKKTLLLCILPFAFLGLSALEWPVEPIIPMRLFGERTEGGFERGLVFGRSEFVRSAAHGAVLMTLESGSGKSRFPGTLGNTVILAHDDGLMSVYGNLESVRQISELSRIDSRILLGSPGNSAWGAAGVLHFQVFDQTRKNLINPLLLLPPLSDTRPPRPRNAILVSGTNQTAVLGTITSVRQGKYRLYAEVTDTIDGNGREMGVFRVSVQVNGTEITTIPFETITASEGRLLLSERGITYNSFYNDPERLFLGEISLVRGRSQLVIIARDMAGNERTLQYLLQVE